MKKRILFGSMALALAMSVPYASVQVSAEEESWAIYWYLCGSDLESDGGAATADLEELLDVELPENVTIVIETGGANEWQNEMVDASYLERYVYDSEDFYLVGQEESASMGDPNTLADFLSFCQENYPADHEAVIFWDHGSGSVQGAVFDELYDYECLSLEDFHTAFASVYDLSKENPPLEMVGFDTCLMATIDTAETFSDIAHYLVASEETEPGCGWNYMGWVGALAENPDMDGAEFGVAICDTYLEGCEEIGQEDETTLSVTDLSKISSLLESYDAIGKEAMQNQYENPSFYTEFSRKAKQAENYGGNTDDAGYTNLVDLGDLIRKNEENFPKHAADVLEALEECVLYHVQGAYRQEASGLSCYYSYNNDEEELQQYTLINDSSFSNFYQYCMTGELSTDLEEYLEGMEYSVEELQDIPILSEVQTEDLPVFVDDDGYATLELDQDTMSALMSVQFQLAYIEEDDDFAMWLGYDNNLDVDWDNGIIRDNFWGTWGAIDGNLCYMEVVYEGEDYNLYLVPILLNGEECQLHVVYDYDLEEYEILGARKGLDDNGMSDRNLITLEPGDQITTLIYTATLYGDDEPELYECDEFTVTEDTYFADEDLGDGEFLMNFLLIDALGNEVWSQEIYFTVEDGEIYTEA